jgi:hypothetical protein
MMLRAAIAALLADPADVRLARSILGSHDVESIASRVEAFVATTLGARVAGCAAFTQSVGAVFVLDLVDRRRVVLKAHALPHHGLAAAYAAQDQLARAGYPCARVLVPPRPWPGGVAALMSYLDAPAADDPHAPSTRFALAAGLARITKLCRDVDATHLPHVTPVPDALFPPAHNALFDLAAPGGEWIDARARAARAVLDSTVATPVTTHGDFSAANVRVSGGAIAAVFDLDSLEVVDEAIAVARAAVHFTYTGDAPWTWPSREQARGFVDDYERERGIRLDRARLDAAAIYALAYTARCEHSIAAADAPMAALLASAPDAYLSS